VHAENSMPAVQVLQLRAQGINSAVSLKNPSAASEHNANVSPVHFLQPLIQLPQLSGLVIGNL
jgi:hypothetical protein